VTAILRVDASCDMLMQPNSRVVTKQQGYYQAPTQSGEQQVGNSLQDQLLKAGLINSQKLKQVRTEKRKENRQSQGNPQSVAESRRRLEEEAAEKAKRDRELNLKRQEEINSRRKRTPYVNSSIRTGFRAQEVILPSTLQIEDGSGGSICQVPGDCMAVC